MKSCAMDLREPLLQAYDHGLGSQRALAVRVGVSHAVGAKGLQQRRTTGEMAPDRRPAVVGLAVMRPRLPASAKGCERTPMRCLTPSRSRFTRRARSGGASPR